MNDTFTVAEMTTLSETAVQRWTGAVQVALAEPDIQTLLHLSSAEGATDVSAASTPHEEASV
jgi:hypothetical protein